MTQEEPRQRKQPSGIVCDECNEAVFVDRDDYDRLLLTCDCDKQRSIRVAAVLPEGWQP